MIPTVIAEIEMVEIATVPTKVADDFDSPRLLAMPKAIAAGTVDSDESAMMKSAVIMRATP